jgi:hypothetical protein
MRRLLLVFLLLVFPVQVTWAAVCVYCPGACVIETSASIRSDSGSEATTDDSAKAGSISLDDSDCACCHLGGVGVASPTIGTAVVKPHETPEQAEGIVLFTSIRPERPERPKWPRAA